MFNILNYLQQGIKLESTIHLAQKKNEIKIPYEEYDSDKYQLKLVQLITRHGRRTPEPKREYPLSLWFCNSSENLISNRDIERVDCNYGYLTVHGVTDMIELGKKYRNLFIDRLKYLDSKYNPTQVFVRSSDKERTISSARSLLHGLYGGSFSENENTLDHTTFVIHKPRDENMQPPIHRHIFKCDKYDFLVSLAKQHPLVIEENNKTNLKEFRKEIDGLLQESKLNNESLYYVGPEVNSFIHLGHEFESFLSHGLDIPKGMNNEKILERMYQESAKESKAEGIYRKDLSPLAIGRFIKDLTHQLQLKSNNDPSVKDLKLAYYSAHDTTLAALMIAYDIYNDKLPPFTSSTLEFLLFEEKQKNTINNNKEKDQYVKVIYNQKVLHVEECKKNEVDNMCPLEDFLRISKEFIPNDWEKQCSITSFEKDQYLENLK